MKPGLFVYHCATPTVAQHIAHGMFGMILVEPKGGLPKVDREFYVMQSEVYTEQPFGTKGEASESYDRLLNETPDYFVFNGAVGALSDQAPSRPRWAKKSASSSATRAEQDLVLPRDRRDHGHGL